MANFHLRVLVDLDDNIEEHQIIVTVPKEISKFSFEPMLQRAIIVVKNCEDYEGLTKEEIDFIEENEFGRDDGFCDAFVWYLENAYHFKCKESKNKFKGETFMVLF